MVTLYYVVLAATAVERLVEMVVSNSNARWSLTQGGREIGREHYPVMVALHSCFLAACAIEPWFRGTVTLPAVAPAAFLIAVGCQALRWWCITTLGRQWNTRVIVVPGLGRVEGGPYRWFSHPNYVAVVIEGIALPAIGGAWITAILFTAANAALLRTRIRTENLALGALAQGVPDGFATGS